MANCDQNTQLVNLSSNGAKQAYLITYSHADLELFDRETFASAIVESFQSSNNSTVSQWVCCKEQHKNGSYHFHIAILLDKAKRWSKVKDHIQENYGIVVNFSDHAGYFSAYNYVMKEDDEVLKSLNHPEVVREPKTANATRSKAARGRAQKGTKKANKLKRLSNTEVASIVVSKKIHARVDLLALAKSTLKSGDHRLYEFVLNRSEKKVKELLDTVWEVETASDKIQRSKMSRLEILQQELSNPCVCKGEWLACALDILDKNSIERAVFADAVIKLFVMGRGKGRNIYITGPANCGKTFILDPVRVVYHTFLSPATCSYAWLGVEDKEVIFLNDFRWSPVILPWSDMLLLLEGHVVHFAAPKTTYCKDIEFTRDTPVFATAKAPIAFIKSSMIDDRETEMMNVRWRIFTFRHQFDIHSQKTVPSCGHCFATMILQ